MGIDECVLDLVREKNVGFVGELCKLPNIPDLVKMVVLLKLPGGELLQVNGFEAKLLMKWVVPIFLIQYT